MNFIFSLDTFSKNLIISLFFLLLTLLVRSFIHIKIQKIKKIDRESKRLLKLNTTTCITLIVLTGLIVIWSSELRNVGLSLMAISAAIVIAGKEIILCLSASMYKSLSRISRIGDRIEINGLRGDVVFSDFLSTTLLEIGPGDKSHQYTGRAVVIPNSYFIQHRTINESFLKDYVLHIISIPIKITDDIESAKDILMKITTEVCAPYIETAKSYINHLQEKRNVETPDPNPRVHMSFSKSDELELLIRITVPSNRKGEIEQEIISKYVRQRNVWCDQVILSNKKSTEVSVGEFVN